MPAETKQSSRSDNSDQRYLPRWGTANRVLYQLENQTKTIESHTRDLSCAGACIATQEEVQAKQKIKMIIYLSKDEYVSLEGDVMWQRKGDEGLEIGVSFSNASVKEQELILNYAFEIDRDKLTKHWFKGWQQRDE